MSENDSVSKTRNAKAVFTCVRTRHPLPSSARGVHMCTRPSSVKYVEYRIAFCLWFSIIAFTVNC